MLLVSSPSRERRINQTRLLYSDNHYFDEYKMDIYPFQGTEGLVRVTFGQFDIIYNSTFLDVGTFEIILARK